MRWVIVLITGLWGGIAGPVLTAKIVPVTSAIPAEVAIARFLQEWGWRIEWYPNWYLGVQVKSLMGPVAPGWLTAGYEWLSWWIEGSDGSIWLRSSLIGMALAWWIGGVGVVWLVRRVSKDWIKAVVVGGGYLTLPGLVWLLPGLWNESMVPALTPWHMTGNVGFGGLREAGVGAVLPWGLVAYDGWLRSGEGRKRKWLAGLGWLTVIMALVEISGLLSLGIGMMVWWIVYGQEKGQTRIVQSGIESLLVLAGGLAVVVMIWYPGDTLWSWWSSASLAGRERWQVVIFIGKYLLVLVPVVAGLIRWKRFQSWSREKKTVMLWLGIYGFLSLARWVADVDFWQDQTKWANELEMGMAWGVGGTIYDRLRNMKKVWMRRLLWGVVGSIIVIQGWRAQEGLRKMTRSGEMEKNEVTEEWLERGETGRVFLTGTAMIWGNMEKVNRLQTRGGEETVVTNKSLLDGVYQIREGDEGRLSWLWLQALGVERVLVQDETSDEFYHDFKYPGKFNQQIETNSQRIETDNRLLESVKKQTEVDSKQAGDDEEGGEYFELIRGGNGRYLYKVMGSGLVRLADKRVMEAEKPSGGADVDRIEDYVGYLGEVIRYERRGPEEWLLEGTKQADQVVWIAMGGGQKWRVLRDGKEGMGIETGRDKWGNLIIKSPDEGSFRYALKYQKENWWMKLMMGGMVLGIGFWLLRRMAGRWARWENEWEEDEE